LGDLELVLLLQEKSTLIIKKANQMFFIGMI
jgi:hypothetical protein